MKKLLAITFLLTSSLAMAQSYNHPMNGRLSSFLDKQQFPYTKPKTDDDYITRGFSVMYYSNGTKYYTAYVEPYKTPDYYFCGRAKEPSFIRANSNSMQKIVSVRADEQVNLSQERAKIRNAFGPSTVELNSNSGYDFAYELTHHGEPIIVFITMDNYGCTIVDVGYQIAAKIEKDEKIRRENKAGQGLSDALK